MRKVHALRTKVERAAMERYRIEGLCDSGAEALSRGKARSEGAGVAADGSNSGAAACGGNPGEGAGDIGNHQEADLKKAMARYNFYLCVKCERPYFGGMKLRPCRLPCLLGAKWLTVAPLSETAPPDAPVLR